MKNLFNTVMMICVSLFIVQHAFAQSDSQVSGLKPDQVWSVVQKVVSNNNLIINYSKTPEYVVTDYREYNAGLIKNRARLVFTYKDGMLTVTLKDRQTLNTNGWADAVFPSKKADEKLCASFAADIRALASNPEEMAKLDKAAPSEATGSSGSMSGSSGIEPSAGATAARKPSLAGAKEVRFDDGDNYLFREGMCALKKNNLWGFIDTTGKVVVDFLYYQWNGIKNPKFSSGIAMVSVQDPSGAGRMPVYIDIKGQQLFKTQKFSGATNFESGLAIVEKTNEKTRARTFHIINKQGQDIPGALVFTPGFSSSSLDLDPFHDGLTKLYDSKTSSYGFINTQGKWAIPPSNYGEVGFFSEGLAPVQSKTNWAWGFINTKGEVKIPIDYKNRPGMFSEGLAAAVNSQEKAGFIDKDGKTVLPFNYGILFPVDPSGNKTGFFKNGYAVAYVEGSSWSGYAIIDRTGKIIRKIGPDQVRICENGWIYYKDGAEYGVLSPEGKDLLVPGYFSFLEEFSNGLAYAVAHIDDKEVKGFVNTNFDFVIIQTY